MKKTLAILLSFLLLFSACTSRSIAPSMDMPSEEKPDVPSVPNVLEQPAPLPPAAENKPQEENDTASAAHRGGA